MKNASDDYFPFLIFKRVFSHFSLWYLIIFKTLLFFLMNWTITEEINKKNKIDQQLFTLQANCYFLFVVFAFFYFKNKVICLIIMGFFHWKQISSLSIYLHSYLCFVIPFWFFSWNLFFFLFLLNHLNLFFFIERFFFPSFFIPLFSPCS
jgi:hypothetical protein